jgi:hypothetical protein
VPARPPATTAACPSRARRRSWLEASPPPYLTNLTNEQTAGSVVVMFRMHDTDPFDRMLAAQALTERATVVTHDRAFEPYGVKAIWT